MTKELVLVSTDLKKKEFFKPNGLDPIHKGIQLKIDEFKPDLTTGVSRKKIASFARKISSTKNAIDDAGKSLVADQKARIKKIDAERKRSRDWCDGKRDEVRKVLTDWEAAEAKRIEEERLIEEYKADFEEAIIEDGIFNRERAIAEKEDELARKEEERRQKEESERIEKERIENEARIKAEAEEQAKREAGEKIKAEREAKEKAEREAEESKKRQEQERLRLEKEAEELALKNERDRIAAEERAKIEKEMAVRKAKEEAEAKARAEREAEEREVARLKTIADKKAANKKHQASINNLVLSGLKEFGIEDVQAKNLVIHIAKGGIPKLRIEY